jgi:phosphotransferase system  glucose/maltose/N-acetylglucosamine-specific IIC component
MLKCTKVRGNDMGILDYLQAKVTSAIGGLLGGTSALRFMHAKDTKDGFNRGALSVIFSVVFGIPLLHYLNLPYQNWEYQLASAFICGFIGFAAMSAASAYVVNKEKELKPKRKLRRKK